MSVSWEICTDNRFEIIEAYKKKLIEGTNIESSPDEMAVIDNILFRFWQMDWLPPIPHGRLIDADALAEDLNFDVENDQRALDQMNFVGKEREYIQFDKDCKQNCMRFLSEAPTIIPASEEVE